MNRQTKKYSDTLNDILKEAFGHDDTSVELKDLHSSYWMRQLPEENVNLITLAPYRRAVANFVSIATGRNTIPVTFSSGNDSYSTANGQVVLSARINNKEFDAVVGLALHEAYHIKHTTFKIKLDRYVTDKLKAEVTRLGLTQENLFGLLGGYNNIIEDRRIDDISLRENPGYRLYYKALYKKYFLSEEMTKALKSEFFRAPLYLTVDGKSDPITCYDFQLTNMLNPALDENALPGLKDILELIDVNNINRLKSTNDSLKLATDVVTLILQNIPTPEPNDADGDESGDNDNSSDDADTTNSDSQGSKSDDEQDDTDTESSDENDSDESNDETDSGDEDDSDESDGDSGDDENDELSDLPNMDIPRSNTSPDTDDKENTDGNDSKENNDDTDDTDDGEYEELSESDKKDLEKSLEQLKDFLNNEVEKENLSDEEKTELDKIEKSGTTIEYVNGDFSNGESVIVVRKLDENNINSLRGISDFYDNDDSVKAIAAGAQLGKRLASRLQIRNETKTYVSKRKTAGKMDKRMLYNLGVGDTNIFDRTTTDSYGDALVHISIDASGSMSGREWRDSLTAAIALAYVAEKIKNFDVVISLRSTQDNSSLMALVYDSRVDKFVKIRRLFPRLSPNGATPEGICYEAIMKEMIASAKGKIPYFINFSDGEPNMSANGKSAKQITREAVNKMRAAGFNIMSFFINGYNLDGFKYMYGSSARSINVTQIVPFARELNKLFSAK